MEEERSGFLASPRRRRRIVRAAGLLGAIGIVVGGFVLIPSHGGTTVPAGGSAAAPRKIGSPDTKTLLAQRRAEAEVRPLADRFANDLADRHALPQAHALLSRRLELRYPLSEWERGRKIPIAPSRDQRYTGATIAFSDHHLVGLVLSFDPLLGGSTESALYAVRFTRTARGWRIDYLHAGHGSRYVDQSNFAPAGFLPGSTATSIWWWFTLPLALAALVALVGFVDLRLGRTADRPRE